MVASVGKPSYIGGGLLGRVGRRGDSEGSRELSRHVRPLPLLKSLSCDTFPFGFLLDNSEFPFIWPGRDIELGWMLSFAPLVCRFGVDLLGDEREGEGGETEAEGEEREGRGEESRKRGIEWRAVVIGIHAVLRVM